MPCKRYLKNDFEPGKDIGDSRPNATSAAMESEEVKVILISDDEAFAEKGFFQHARKEYEVDNIETHKRIVAFLSVYGFRSP